MARTDPQTNIRLPADLKEGLMKAAKESGRTFGAEVVFRLENSLMMSTTPALVESRVEEIETLDQEYKFLQVELAAWKNDEVRIAEGTSPAAQQALKVLKIAKLENDIVRNRDRAEKARIAMNELIDEYRVRVQGMPPLSRGAGKK